MLLVPLLAGWCRLPGKTCFTTALAVMLPLTLVSLAIYWHSGQLPFSLAWPYLAGGFLGGVGGGLLLRRVPVRWQMCIRDRSARKPRARSAFWKTNSPERSMA